MADGALNPLFDQAEFEKEKEKMIEGLKADEKSVTAIARRVENVLVLEKSIMQVNSPVKKLLKNVTLDDVILNYNTYFVPANAYLVIVVMLTLKKLKRSRKIIWFLEKSNCSTVNVFKSKRRSIQSN